MRPKRRKDTVVRKERRGTPGSAEVLLEDVWRCNARVNMPELPISGDSTVTGRGFSMMYERTSDTEGVQTNLRAGARRRVTCAPAAAPAAAAAAAAPAAAAVPATAAAQPGATWEFESDQGWWHLKSFDTSGLDPGQSMKAICGQWEYECIRTSPPGGKQTNTFTGRERDWGPAQ